MKPTSRGCQREAILQGNKVHLLFGQFIEQLAQALGSARQAIKPPADDPLDLSSPQIVQQLFRARAIHRLAGELVPIPLHRPIVSRRPPF
jgi:hypothetical protein